MEKNVFLNKKYNCKSKIVVYMNSVFIPLNSTDLMNKKVYLIYCIKMLYFTLSVNIREKKIRSIHQKIDFTDGSEYDKIHKYIFE